MESTTTHLHLPVWKLHVTHGCLYATSPLLFLLNNLFGDYRKCTLFFIFYLSFGVTAKVHTFLSIIEWGKNLEVIYTVTVLCLWRSVSKGSYVGN